MWPEWDEVEVPVDDLHLGGTGKENPELLLRSSSMAESFSVFPCSFSLTSVLDSQRHSSHGDVLHQGDGLFRAHLGHRNGGGVVAVNTGVTVEGEFIMLTSFGTHLGLPVVE